MGLWRIESCFARRSFACYCEQSEAVIIFGSYSAPYQTIWIAMPPAAARDDEI